MLFVQWANYYDIIVCFCRVNKFDNLTWGENVNPRKPGNDKKVP